MQMETMILFKKKLVGALEHFLFFHILRIIIIPTDELHHFSEGWLAQNHQPEKLLTIINLLTIIITSNIHHY